MPLPPEASYPSLATMKEAIASWTFEHGYDVVLQGKNMPHIKLVQCGRSGTTQNTHKLNEETRQRDTSTRKCGCLVRFWYVADDKKNTDGTWSVRYVKDEGQSRIHNHQPFLPGTTSANHRRRLRSKRMEEAVQNHIQSGVPTRQTMAILQYEFPHSFQTRKDIANLRLCIRACLLQTQTVADGTVRLLREKQFFAEYDLEDALVADELPAGLQAKRLKRMFIAYPLSTKLFRKFNDVIVLRLFSIHKS